MAGEVFAELAAETGLRDAKPCEVKEERRELAGVEMTESAVLRDLSEGLRLKTFIRSMWRREDEAEEEEEEVGVATSSES